MGRIGISAPFVAPVLADDVRRALLASADLAAVLRMRRRGWLVDATPRAVRGRRGPAFSAMAKRTT